jgi:hypothetical protein
MMVEITSLAPVRALRKPAIPPQKAPAPAASAIERTTWISAGRPSNDEPAQTATIAPTMYWPCPPMLNRPARKA